MSKSTEAELQANARKTFELLQRLNEGIEALNTKLQQSVNFVEAAMVAEKPKAKTTMS